MRCKIFKALMITATFLVFVSPAAFADLEWVSEEITRGVPGEQDGSVMVKNYYKDDAIRTERGNEIMIMDYNTMTMYQINESDKTYTKTNLDEMMGGGDSEEARGMQAMMQSMMSSVKVVPSDEKKTVAGYDCKKYMISFMMVNSEYWVSKDVKGYEELKSVNKKLSSKFKNNPMLKMTNFTAMLDEMDGFPVQMIVNVMGGTTTTTLKSMTQKKSLGKSLFTVPAGYKLQ